MAKNNPSDKKVTRIKASDSAAKPAKKAAPKVTTKTVASQQPAAKKQKTAKKTKVPARDRGGIIGYFAGAWYELRQVRWPTRGATWSLTAAVLGFSAFFVVFILLIDALFKFLFEIILK